MVPKVVQDAGYTAVGLGVLALQQVQTRRRDAGRRAEAVLGTVKTIAAPLTRHLDDLPRLPGPIGTVLEHGRARLAAVLRPAA